MKASTTNTISVLKDTFVNSTWPFAVTLARKTVLSILSGIEEGHLSILDKTDNTKYSFGKQSPVADTEDVHPKHTYSNHDVQIVVHCDYFWLKLFLFADLGFAESYMLGDFECNDLTAFFRIFITNRNKLNDGMNIFSSLSSMLSRIGRVATNTRANSLLNTAAHYDISNEMFAAFLSEDMTYSCPIWRSVMNDSTSDIETLEDAQKTKLLRFIDGAKIKPTDHVLEIGSGWGSFAIEAVRGTGCRITTITLSRKQKELAEERIALAGLTHRIEVRFADYRDLSSHTETFDKIVSIEMLEAVGEAHMAEYFALIHRLLKKDGGIAMFQCITFPESLHTNDTKKGGFAGKYIFPGGYLPSTTQLVNHISTQSEGTLTIERIENIGGHYAKALRQWRENFISTFDEKIMPALMQTYPEMSEESIDVFRRKWEYYFAYCEAGFMTKALGDVIITVGRVGAMELMEQIPL